jgi:hypothetical protein
MPRALAVFAFAVFAFALLLLVAAGCREEDLCVRTVRATCLCDDPLQPSVTTCISYADVVSCAAAPDADVDPCRVNPCCRIARPDGGTDGYTSVRDLGNPPRDSGDDLGDGGAPAEDAAAPTQDAAPEDLSAPNG